MGIVEELTEIWPNEVCNNKLVGLLGLLFIFSMTGVSKWSILEMHMLIELHRHRGGTSNIGQILASYTKLYLILDKYHYSKAPNDFDSQAIRYQWYVLVFFDLDRCIENLCGPANAKLEVILHYSVRHLKVNACLGALAPMWNIYQGLNGI